MPARIQSKKGTRSLCVQHRVKTQFEECYLQ